jgi:hypothetical protein
MVPSTEADDSTTVSLASDPATSGSMVPSLPTLWPTQGISWDQGDPQGDLRWVPEIPGLILVGDLRVSRWVSHLRVRPDLGVSGR